MERETLLDRAVTKVAKVKDWRKPIAALTGYDPSEIDAKIRERDERVMHAIFHAAGFGGKRMVADTMVKRIIQTAVDRAAVSKRLYAIYGPTGCGKTWTAEAVISEYRDYVAYVRVNEFNRSSRLTFVRDIAVALKLTHAVLERSIKGVKVLGSLREEFESKRRCVVIDEAQKLKDNTFELLRDLYDETKLSVVLLGSMAFRDSLARKKIGDEIFGQFLRRLDDRYELPHSSPSDVRAFWSLYGVQLDPRESKEIAKRIARWGDMDTLAKAVTKIASLHNEGELSWRKVGAGDIVDAIERVIEIQRIPQQELDDETKS